METQVSKILDLLTKGMEGVPDIASQAFQIMVRGEFVNGVQKSHWLLYCSRFLLSLLSPSIPR